MNKYMILYAVLSLGATTLLAQTAPSTGTFWHPNPRNYTVKQALEVESLVPMFLFGGYHFAVGYRYKKFRVRASVINGGTYNAETVGLNDSPPAFKRFCNTSPGIFFGYNVWKTSNSTPTSKATPSVSSSKAPVLRKTSGVSTLGWA